MRFIRYLPAVLALLALPVGVFAHPLDAYVQATLVVINPGEIRLQINLTPGVVVAERVLGLIDRNHDGVISSNECAAYAELLKRDLVVRLDGRAAALSLVASDFPEPAELRTGWGIIQMEYAVNAGVLAGGSHKFILENRHQPVASAYLFNAARPASALIQVTGQKRNENQSTGEIAFEYRPPPSPSLKAEIFVPLVALFIALFAGGWYARKKQRVFQRNQSPAGALPNRVSIPGLRPE